MILYGNWPKQAKPAPAPKHRVGMLTNNIPDADNSQNIEDQRGEGDDTSRELPRDFSINNPPWQWWRHKGPAYGLVAEEYKRPEPKHQLYDWCPPEQARCWRR